MQRIIIIVAIGVCLPLVVLTETADAVPGLQLYIPGSTYDTATESWLTTDNPFMLQVLGASHEGNINEINNLELYIAVPANWFNSGGIVTVTGPGYESGTTLIFNSSTPQGTPTLPTPSGKKPKDLPSHGIYPTYYFSLALPDMDVKSGSDIIKNYNPDESDEDDKDTGVIYEYTIGYQGVFGIHIDVAGIAVKKNGKEQSIFAPFSHDADAPPIPEPATLLILGVGIGIIGWRRMRYSRIG